VVILFTALNPCPEQRIGDGEHHRADEQPTTPNAIKPPMTPAKISSNGRSAPFLMRTGRRKLSIMPTKIAHTSRMVPHTGSPFQ